MTTQLNYERQDPDSPPRRWSTPALVGLPLGICGPGLAIALTIELHFGLFLLFLPLSISGGLVCSLIGARDTNPEANRKRGRGVAVAGVLINMTLLLLLLSAILMLAGAIGN